MGDAPHEADASPTHRQDGWDHSSLSRSSDSLPVARQRSRQRLLRCSSSGGCRLSAITLGGRRKTTIPGEGKRTLRVRTVEDLEARKPG